MTPQEERSLEIFKYAVKSSLGAVAIDREDAKNIVQIITDQEKDIEFWENRASLLENENKKLKEQLQALGDRIESLTENQDIWQTGYVSMEGHAWELSRQLQTAKAETIKKYREKAAIKLAQNARSDYWHWIDDTLYEVEKEIVGEYR